MQFVVHLARCETASLNVKFVDAFAKERGRPHELGFGALQIKFRGQDSEASTLDFLGFSPHRRHLTIYIELPETNL